MGEAKVKTFEDLDIWINAIELYTLIYAVCENLSMKNDFSAKDQLKRATLSISNNIAEGFEYENNLQFIRFLKYAKGSAGEVRSMAYAFLKTNQISQIDCEIINEKVKFISKSINNFIKY